MIDSPAQPHRTIRWLIAAWIALIVSGASTTGLLRAPLGVAWVAPLTYRLHWFGGSVAGLLTMVQIVRVTSRRRTAWLGAALIGVTVAMGWLSARSLAPRIVAAHAFIAAVAAVALASAGAASSSAGRMSAPPAPRPGWSRVAAQFGFGLVAVQVAVGAALRHQQVVLMWHLLVGGLAVLALLVPAVAILQAPGLSADERRAARSAIATVVVQVALGATVFFMMLVGPPSTAAWLAATIAHVTVGTLTLLSAARFASVVAAH